MVRGSDLAEELSPPTTCDMLGEAAKLLPSPAPAVSIITDGDVENVNSNTGVHGCKQLLDTATWRSPDARRDLGPFVW